jgi:lysylphosphatidylglycerol synthetase-like protein (DUF2156 family)
MKRIKQIDVITQAILIVLVMLSIVLSAPKLRLLEFNENALEQLFTHYSLPYLYLSLLAVQLASYIISTLRTSTLFVQGKRIYCILLIVQILFAVLYFFTAYESVEKILLYLIALSPLQMLLCFAATYQEYQKEVLHFNLFSR